MARYDEDMDRVRRSHFVETAFDRVDVAKLGALFDMAPADWEPTALFRIRLLRTIGARLKGAVTRAPLDELMTALLDAAQQALGTRYGNLAPGAGGNGVSRSGGGAASGRTDLPRVSTRSGRATGP